MLETAVFGTMLILNDARLYHFNQLIVRVVRFRIVFILARCDIPVDVHFKIARLEPECVINSLYYIP